MRKTIDRELVVNKLLNALNDPENIWSREEYKDCLSEYAFKFGVLSRAIEIIIEDIEKGEGGF